MSDLWEQVTTDAQLISLPAVYLQLKAVLDDPEYSMADVESIISQDPAITTRLLRQVNSAFFGFAGNIDRVSRAVSLMGSQEVHDLVLATSVAQTFEGVSIEVMDMHAFWWRSVYCAVAARLLATRCNVMLNERLFVTGLLRDIGHLIMYQSIPQESQQALVQAGESGKPLYQVERELMGFDYAKVGGALLEQWGLPQSLWEPVKLHVTPDQSTNYFIETAIIHMAGVLAEVADTEIEPDDLVSLVDPEAWQATGVGLESYAAVRDEVDQQIDDVLYLIFPHSKTLHAGSHLRSERSA
jgi:HD-like signal output (HDOD) protein